MKHVHYPAYIIQEPTDFLALNTVSFTFTFLSLMFLSNLVATAIAFSCLDLSRKYIIFAPDHKKEYNSYLTAVLKEH